MHTEAGRAGNSGPCYSRHANKQRICSCSASKASTPVCCRGTPRGGGIDGGESGALGGSGGGGRQGGKGLRHFSMKVCQKVEGKGRTTYNEVADELVHEFSAPGPQGAHPGRTTDPVLTIRSPDS